jgi:SPP1 family predicted phage head-tail adaptor
MIINDAFQLDKRVVLQVKSGARDSLNKLTNTWANVLPGAGEIWAAITDLSGHQYVVAGAQQNAVQTQIKIRRRAGVVPSMRVLHGATVYDIQAVLERDRHWLVLMCTKGLTNG